MKKKVVLAYSGGLDTSYCALYLKNVLNYDVYSVIADTGGFSKQELQAIEERAYALGVIHHETLSVEELYYDKAIKYMIFGNVLRNNCYPISVSSERTFQAQAIAQYALSIHADAIAHGSTGAGNDQIRFDLTFSIYAPHIPILTPTRDLKLSRQEEIDYLKQAGVEGDWSKLQYSINKGLWGTSIGGVETLDPMQYLPDDAYPSPLKEKGEQLITIEFEQGEPIAVDGVHCAPIDAIRQLEEIASRWAIGRDTHVGDTIVGIKGRVGFEAAAPLLLIKTHGLLEKHTLSKWQQYWKEQLGNWYGMFLHESQYDEPVMRDIEQFLQHSQTRVTGVVTVRLRPYHFDLLSVASPFDLIKNNFAQYGEGNDAWSADDVKGFTKMMSIPILLHKSVGGA